VTVVDALRDHLVTAELVRDPAVADDDARPWAPPCWRHPANGAIGPGDREGDAADDGLVVSLMHAAGVGMEAGAEERRRKVVDIVLRGTAMPALLDLEAEIRKALLGDPPQPGGQTDWVMGGLYVVQCVEWRPLQPVEGPPEAYTFVAGYLFEVRFE
jgi:hypothetical protein